MQCAQRTIFCSQFRHNDETDAPPVLLPGQARDHPLANSKEMAYEEDFSPFVPCGYSRAGGSKPDHRLRRCERWQDPSDVPDLGRCPARRYAGHVRRLHGTAPRRRHRGAGHQLGRVLDQTGSGHHGQTGPRHFLDAHQRDPQVRRQRQAARLLGHRRDRALLRHFAGQRQRLGRQAVRRPQGQGLGGPGLQ